MVPGVKEHNSVHNEVAGSSVDMAVPAQSGANRRNISHQYLASRPPFSTWSCNFTGRDSRLQ